MARYDWPSPPESMDDAEGRTAYRAALRPSVDVRHPDGSLEPVVRPAAPTSGSRRAAPVAAPPVGGQDLWLPIGPSELVKGQATGRPNVSGRIRDLAVDDRPGGVRAYAASAGGGVWFSEDAGFTWRPLDEFFMSPNRTTVTPVGAALSCGALHVQFGADAHGADDEVWVGTGEPSSQSPGGNPGGSLLGVGVLHATGPAVAGHPWAVEAGSEALRGRYVWRIVASPLDAQHLFAATSAGVFHRPPGRPWSLLGTVPADEVEPVDLVVTSPAAGALRLWAPTWKALRMGELALPLPAPADPQPTVTFAAVDLPDAAGWTNKSVALGAVNELWILGRRNPHDAEREPRAQLWRLQPNAATPKDTVAAISGVPPDLFGAQGHDQSFYDMCMVVHPENPNRVLVGGSATYVHGDWNASAYSLVVAGTAATPTLIGDGVHSDVHVLRVGPRVLPAQPSRVVWIGCDGGLFSSSADGAPGTFLPRNEELATLEPGYVACHPTNDGIVAAGLQDNGTCERRGDSVWEVIVEGDGGGTVYDPGTGGGSGRRLLTQYVNATWSSSTGGTTPPVLRHGNTPTDSEKAENRDAVFYSGAAALAHGDRTHLLIGTNRPWYSADWGATWVTLPTGTDPRAGSNPNDEQDRLDSVGQSLHDGSFECCSSRRYGGVLSTRLSVADLVVGTTFTNRVRAHVLWGGGLAMFLGTQPATAGQAWTWAREQVRSIRTPNDGPEATIVEQGIPTNVLFAGGKVTDVAVHEPDRGPHGSCYVTTIGGASPTIDTVWWYDGTDLWWPCGVRNPQPVGRATWTGDRIVAPAMAVVVDPTDPKVVFVGTSIGVIRGELSFVDVNGESQPHWNWRPFDNGLPETAVNDLSIFADDPLGVGDPKVRVLRAALHGRGVWEVDLATPLARPRTFLRVYPTDTRRRAVVELAGPATRGESVVVRFDASPDVVVDPSTTADLARGPSEADIVRLSPPLLMPGAMASLQIDRAFRMRVLVHHRWPVPATPAQVRVALLRKDLGATDTDADLGAIWPALVAIAGGGAVPDPLPDGWLAAGPQLLAPVAADVDPRRPRAATFAVDLSGHAAGRVMFLAVVLSEPDPITDAEGRRLDNSLFPTVSELVLHSRHAVARSMELI